MRINLLFFLLLTPFSQSCNNSFGASRVTNLWNIVGDSQYKPPNIKYNFIVSDLESLKSALSKAQSGQVVYIKDDVEINLTDSPAIVISEGLTLASGRDNNDSKGALLFTKNMGHTPAFLATGNKVRITGIRLSDADTLRRVEQMYKLIAKNDYYSLPTSYGIQCHYADNLEVDGCELSGWSYGAISLRDSYNNHIHHNCIHHNQRLGLGYGIILDRAEAVIEYNHFDWNRHSITGSGRANTSYTIHHNFFGLHSLNYVIDMHKIKDETLGKEIAGSEIVIYDNIFLTEEDGAIVIHGNPTKTILIYDNFFNKDTKSSIPVNLKAEDSLI